MDDFNMDRAAKSTKATGWMVAWRAMELIGGQMDHIMRVNIEITSKKVKVNTLTQTDEYTMVSGGVE
jgi:hypothetical protein